MQKHLFEHFKNKSDSGDSGFLETTDSDDSGFLWT